MRDVRGTHVGCNWYAPRPRSRFVRAFFIVRHEHYVHYIYAVQELFFQSARMRARVSLFHFARIFRIPSWYICAVYKISAQHSTWEISYREILFGDRSGTSVYAGSFRTRARRVGIASIAMYVSRISIASSLSCPDHVALFPAAFVSARINRLQPVLFFSIPNYRHVYVFSIDIGLHFCRGVLQPRDHA